MSYHRALMSFQTLQKLAASLEQDVQQSKDLKDITARMLAHQATLGRPHIPPHDAAVITRTPDQIAVKRDAGSGPAYKQTLSQILDSDVAPAGERVVHRVRGVDQNERARQELGAGPGQRRREMEHTRVFPGGYSHEESHSSVKVAAAKTPELKAVAELRAKVRNLKANKDALPKYRPLILSEPLIIDVALDALPEVPFPPNDSPIVAHELAVIRDTMDLAPVPEDVMELADEEPLELFRRVCTDLRVPFDEDIVPLLVSDLRRYAMSLKYIYGRPRPYELAPYYEVAIIPTDVDPYEGSPSYPSIHSTIGYGVANYYGYMYPQHTDAFNEVAELIAMQRVQTGHHYPSDNAYAKIIADALLNTEQPPAAPPPAAAPPEPAAQTAPEKTATWQPRRIKVLR
jgi:hypothetical protein